MYSQKAELVDKIDQNEDILNVRGYDSKCIVFATNTNEIVYYDIYLRK